MLFYQFYFLFWFLIKCFVPMKKKRKNQFASEFWNKLRLNYYNQIHVKQVHFYQKLKKNICCESAQLFARTLFLKIIVTKFYIFLKRKLSSHVVALNNQTKFFSVAILGIRWSFKYTVLRRNIFKKHYFSNKPENLFL